MVRRGSIKGKRQEAKGGSKNTRRCILLSEFAFAFCRLPFAFSSFGGG
jgi:hypothetical protein